MGKWYDTHHVEHVDPYNPQTIEFPIYMTDFVYNKLLQMCDKHNVSPDQYIFDAVIQAMKKEGEWF